jgi:NAD(P)-dependent dehydrogenase (short-subunit alcohol dehydrogenase family)
MSGFKTEDASQKALSALRSGPADLTGRVAIVTGAARGIGSGIARTLHAHGAHVAILDLTSAEEAASALDPSGERALGLAADVTDSEAVRAAVDAVLARWGRIDLLVNNAGLGDRVHLAELDLAHFERIIGPNLRSAFLCSQAVLPAMRRQGGGKIVNVSSVSAKVGGVTSRDPATGQGRSGPSYAAAKGGMISLTRWLAKDSGGDGVLVNVVCPGPIATDAIKGADYDLSQTPVARLGTPDDVAQAVLFLGSQMSNYITGQSLNVDGGLRPD